MGRRARAAYGALLGFLPLLLSLGGCEAATEAGGADGRGATIIQFVASPERVVQGETIRLRWTTLDAASLSLFGGDQPIEVPGGSWAQGSLELAPEATTRFRLEVAGADGRVVSEEREVVVLPLSEVAIERFVAAPERVARGEAVTLSWATRHADSIRILDGRRQELKLGSSSPAGGSVTIHPTRSAVYQLELQGAAGVLSATAAVEVVPAPQLRLRQSAAVVAAGDELWIEWETQDAERLVLWEGDELVLQLDPLKEAEGRRAFLPRRATTYRLEVSGVGGSAAAAVQVEVAPTIERFEVEVPQEKLRLGMSLPITWRVLGAASLSLSDRLGSVASFDREPAIEPWSDSAELLIRAEGAFEIEARNGEQITRERLYLDLVQEPVIGAFAVGSGPQTASADDPAVVDLGWEVFGARSLWLRSSHGEIIDLRGASAEAGTLQVEVEGPTSFTLVAENPWGIAEAVIDAMVEEAPRILFFEAVPRRVAAGGETILRWETASSPVIELWEGGTRIASFGEELAVGSLSRTVTGESQFELRASNLAGDQAVATQTVDVGAPLIDAFTVNRRLLAPGESIALSWQSSGGDQLELLHQDGLLFTTTEMDEIREGSHLAQVPSSPGTTSYSLSIRNGAGISSSLLEVEVTEGPIIDALTVHPKRTTSGDEVELRWTVRRGSDAEVPLLVLTDGQGKVYDLDPADIAEGRTRLRLEAEGIHDLRLKATGPAGSSSASVEVEVVPAPALIWQELSPPFAAVEGDPVVLAWRTRHASVLHLEPIDDEGLLQGPALFTTTTEVAEGSFELRPELQAPHVRVRLENELGADRSFDLRVGVNPPTLSRFEAHPETIARGQASTLVWTAERTTKVELEATPRIETDEPFLDLSALPQAERVAIGKGQLDTALLLFPDGFSFPFDGSSRKGLRVANTGYVSFDLLQEFGTLGIAGFPDPNSRHVHLAPFLGRLDPGGGEILYALLGQGADRHLVIHFHDFSLAGVSPSRLNFELILWPDGSFDFRYGEMESPSDPAAAAGAAGQIGSQDARGSKGLALSNRSVVPGGLANRSFHHPVVALPIGVEVGTKPLVSIAGAPHAVELTGGSRFFTNALYPFPDGFTFPFGGALRQSARITKDGYLSFATNDDISYGVNRKLAQGAASGAGGTARVVHLAPFWANLSRIHGDGEIWVAMGVEDETAVLQIQWLRFAHEADPNSELNFEVLLRKDGSFEYRYGSMVREQGGLPAGEGYASIGYQEPNGVRGVELFYREAVPGGLAGKSWHFQPSPSLPLQGSMEVRPRGSVEYRLMASSPNGSHRLAREVEVMPLP